MQTTKERVVDQTRYSSDVSPYQALDFFMLRTPVFPLENYMAFSSIGTKKESNKQEIFNEFKEYITAAIDNPIFREAIAVASLPLYQSLDKLQKGSSKKSEQILFSLLSYYIRMSVRPTPFGLFSGVTMGTFKENTEVILNKHFEKRSRPDMQWLCNVVKLFEQDYTLLSNLLVQKNHLLYRHGDVLILPYLSSHGVKEDSTIDNASFKITPVIEDVLNFASSPITFKDLISKIHNKYQDVPQEKIALYLNSMVEKEFLITELRPPFLGTSPFEYVLQKVESLHPNPMQSQLYQQVNSIYQTIKEYNCSELGQGEDQYISLTEEMMNVVKTKYALQVDLKINTEKAQLNKSVKQDIERAAEILVKISSRTRGSEHIQMYYDEFVEMYGYYSEVPVLELLDNGLGIGAPPTYANPPSLKTFNSNNKNTKKDFIFLSWVTDCLASGKNTLQLTDQMIKELEGETKDLIDAPDSFDIYFTIASKSQKAIDCKEYTLVIGPNGGSFGAGKTFGRFVNMLGNENVEKLKDIHILEQELNPDAIFAEVSYLSSSSRVANVMLAPSIREYEIPIGTNSSKDVSHTLDMSDLVVGASSNRLYLKSKSLGKEVIPVTGHMVNYMNGVPNIYRFLMDIGFERQRIWEPFNWGEADQLPFLPRVQYENIVLYPATWRFNKLVSPFSKVCNEKDWGNALKEWKETYNVPRYINLTDFDNRILLDLDNKIHQEFIFRKFSKLREGNFLIFTELGFSLDENWVTSKNNENEMFLMEGIFPIVKSSSYQEKEVKRTLVLPNTRKNYIPKIDRFKNIGSDWLYLKLYGPSDRIDELIYNEIRSFCSSVQAEGIVKRSFFMRYADPQSHIRLRFQGDPQVLLNSLLPLIHNWVNALMKKGLVDEMKLDPYNPEIERYGGSDFIGIAEELFSVDSRVAAELLLWKEFEGVNFNKNLLAVMSIVHILEASGLSMERQLAWLNMIVPNQKHPKEFRENKQLFVQLCDTGNEWSNLKEHENLVKLHNIFSLREATISNYFKTVYSTNIDDLTNHPDDILASVIHLHLNRLGIHSTDEEHIMKLTKHTVQSLFFTKK